MPFWKKSSPPPSKPTNTAPATQSAPEHGPEFTTQPPAQVPPQAAHQVHPQAAHQVPPQTVHHIPPQATHQVPPQPGSQFAPPPPTGAAQPARVPVPNQQPGTPFVRAYQPEDFDALLTIFETTADSSLQTPSLLHLSSHLYLRPYTYFHTSECVCLVLDSGAGAAVGYIIGALDTPSFVRAWKDSYLPSLQGVEGLSVMHKGSRAEADVRGQLWRPEGLEMSRWPGLVEGFPAHLHIDLLPKYQRGGYGRLLMHAFCNILRARGVKGIHLGMSAHNHIGPEQFYAKMGFERFPEVMDGGASKKMGQTTEGTVYMVGKLD